MTRRSASGSRKATALAFTLVLASAIGFDRTPVHGSTGPSSASDSHRPDPCEQIFDVPGQAHGLNKQCEGKGGGAGVAKGDFNGDGFADLAVGAPFEDVSDAFHTVGDAGAVHVLYGSATGLTATGNQRWTKPDFGPGSYAETSDQFGTALASGDFNGDGYSDLAIGVPGQACGSGSNRFANCGGVRVLYGSSSGLTITGAQIFDDEGGKFCRYGAALVWADFNGDGYGDLAIGEPKAPFNEIFSPEAGDVMVHYGSANGLQASLGVQVVVQGNASGRVGVGDSPEGYDHFGAVLAAGDINGDGYHDLVIGVPDEDYDLFTPDAGMIHVVFGSPTGLVDGTAQTLTQGTSGVSGAPESGDRIGFALAVGDFNGDGYADVAVGEPFEDIGTKTDAGAVQVFYGSSTGLRTDNDRFFDQSDLNNTPEAGDHFGWSLAAGKFDSGNYTDLAIGSPGEDFNTSSAFISNIGLVLVMFGSSSGLQTTNPQGFLLGNGGITQPKAAGDQFGYSLTAWNFGNGDRSDLVIGIPYRDVTLSTGTVVTDAGALLVLYGQSTGLTTTGYQFWTLASPGVLGSPQTSGRFGYALY
jgi:FG-GAP repeat protein